MDARRIVEALNGPIEDYQREAVQAAMDHPDEVVPLLLEHLREVLRGPDRFLAADYGSPLEAYAIVLLSHHRVREAHEIFVELLSLPGETPYDLFGDLVTEIFCSALWKTSGGDVTSIKRLIENQEAYEFARCSAVKSLTYGVAEGGLAREDVVGYLQGLISFPDTNRRAGPLLDKAAATLCDLWPGESMDIINRAYEDGLIWPGFIGPESFEEALEEGKEACLEGLRQRESRRLAADPHAMMEWWACFKSKRSSDTGILADHRGAGRQDSAKKNAAKRQRRQAKAARRKGRGKGR